MNGGVIKLEQGTGWEQGERSEDASGLLKVNEQSEEDPIETT